jgi:hypothetical protein
MSKEPTFLELKNLLNLEMNQCYKKLIEVENIIYINKSKYVDSSMCEIREMVDIKLKLERYEEYLDVKVMSNKIILKFKSSQLPSISPTPEP